jgi:hypothetical protein
MHGSRPRNFQPLTPSYVRPSFPGFAVPQAPILPTNSETQQLMHGSSTTNGHIPHIVHAHQNSTGTADPNRWHKPQQGRHKCNIDAAFSSIRNHTGIGICLRDDNGAFVLAKTMSLSLGLLYAMQWMHDMQFDNVDFVVDSKITTYAFHSKRIDVTEFGHVISACRDIFSTFTNSGWSSISDKQMMWLLML